MTIIVDRLWSAPGTPLTPVCGAVASTVHVLPATSPTLPTASVPRTDRVCEPSVRPVTVSGEVQTSHVPASRRQPKVAASSAEKDTVADRSRTARVPVATVTTGAVASTDQARRTEAPTLPAASVPRTARLCAPSRRPVRVSGSGQAAKAPASTEPRSADSLLATAKAWVREALVLPSAGPCATVSTGAWVSTTTSRVTAAVAKPSESTARAATRWAPSASPGNDTGVVQEAHAAPSTWHWKAAAGGAGAQGEGRCAAGGGVGARARGRLDGDDGSGHGEGADRGGLRGTGRACPTGR
ncbi:hypothetical protein GCM10025868_14500 [Angustibacter aerolatus]|uniref:Uncharacterized protein n=1 Tax=Angustibacter aerolatus TaxID=1162965 RepID=A0ABQ6JH75_9ACTN|nr:hypothetical protein GCM10025868_14500 [Angustibacter aerolatus]